MVESVSKLCALREKIAAIEGRHPERLRVSVPLGVTAVDSRLNGGLATGRLHEFFAAEPQDAPSAAGLAVMLACRMLTPSAPLVWLGLDDGLRLHAPGLAEIGFDPARLVFINLPDPQTLLRTAADVLRCPGAGMAVIKLRRNERLIDLTTSRRLALAAEASGVTALLLRVEADPVPSAAQTRWRVAAGPSTALEAQAPGHPVLDLELLRQRGRPPGGRWLLEWDRDRRCFHEAALPSALVSDTFRRPAAQESATGLRRAS